MITAQQITDLIKSRIEPTEYLDKMLQLLQENEGKRIDLRLIKKLQAAMGDDSIRNVANFGMTQIVWQKAPTGLLCAYAEKNVHVDSAWIKEKNTWAYEARDERNRKRHNDLGRVEAIQELANAANAFKVAKERLSIAMDGFEDIHSLVCVCGDPDSND